MTLTIIYLSNGQRHQTLTTYHTNAAAFADLAAFRAAGWIAWIEVVQ